MIDGAARQMARAIRHNDLSDTIIDFSSTPEFGQPCEVYDAVMYGY